MNKELLKQLYCIFAPSGNEKKMRKFIKRQARKCGATKIEQDIHGNLFITKGDSPTYPCLAAHMDQVQHAHGRDFVCIEGHGVVFGYSPKSHEQQGLGADDKNGIFICLECLAKYDVLKLAFFVGEEVGCKGSSACDLSFFSDCRFIIEPDRRGSSDLITSMFCGEVCSEEFINAIDADIFGYTEETGSITDVGELTERGVGISCLNLSCGYYEAHSDQEFTVLDELENCLDFVQYIIENCIDVYKFEYKPRYHYYGGGYSGFYGRSYGGDMYHYYNDEDYAYEIVDMVLSSDPDATYEDCIMQIDIDTLSRISESKMHSIYDELKELYEPRCADIVELPWETSSEKEDEDEEVAAWNRSFN